MAKKSPARKQKGVSDVRVKTGVKGMDVLLNGGIPEGNIVLLSGGAGTGKSLFSLEFIYHGARDFNEPGVYITLEEFPDRFIENARKLGFSDIEDLIARNKMAVVRTDVFDIDKLVSTIEDLIDKYGAKRVVIDSISVISAFAEKPFHVRRTLFSIANMLKRQSVTSIFTSGSYAGSSGVLGFTVEEYAVDGVISLFHTLSKTQFIRAIGVVKMRGTAHTESLHPVMITEQGLVVLKNKTFPEDFSV